MLDAAYDAWRADCAAGRASILVTESARAVRALNERARAERLLARRRRRPARGRPGRRQPSLGRRHRHHPPATTARIRTMRGGWVKNGDRWRVTDIRRDGSVVVERLGPATAGETVLPAEYVARARRPRVRRHRAPRPGHHRRHGPRRRDAVDDAGEPLRLHDPRPRLQHRVRRPRPARRQPLHARAGRRHRADRAVRRPPAQRRRPLGHTRRSRPSTSSTAASTASPPSSRRSPPTLSTIASSTCCAARA